MAFFLRVKSFIPALCLVLSMGLADPASGDITLDNSFGTGSGNIPGPDYAITADLGMQQGTNLFHSFHTFNVNTGETANFSGPDTIANIISRVTGGTASTIDGTLRSAIDGASLFLINPSGVMFGPNAALDITGSFHASTGDYLLFGDNNVFYADPAVNSVLTSAPVSAFGFLDADPAPLAATGCLLAVPAGQAISLAGGDITLENTNLFARSGVISLTAPGGKIQVDRTQTHPYYDAQTQIADIEAGGMETGSAGGSVSIVAGQLVMTGAFIRTDTHSDADAGGIHMAVDTDINIQGGLMSASTYGQGNSGRVTISADTFTLGSSGQILMETYGEGRSGDGQSALSLTARQVSLVGGGQIASSTYYTGDAGDMDITATESVTLSGAQDLYYSGLFSNSFGTAPSGKITIETPSLVIDNEATIHVAAFGQGDANAPGEDAVHLKVGTLAVDSGGQVSSRSGGSGSAGTIRVDADQSVSLNGQSAFYTSGIVADSYATGDGGSIYVTSPLLTMGQGATISNAMYDSGSPGSIILNVDTMVLSGASRVNAVSYGAAGAGNISVTAADSLSIVGTDVDYLSGFYTNAFGSGPGGNISISAPDTVISHRGIIQAAGFGSGNAGSIDMDVDTLAIESGGRISAASDGTGSAGKVDIAAAAAVTVDGILGDMQCGIFALTGEFAAGGGDITVTTPMLSMNNDSRIEASTDSASQAGDIHLFLESLVLTDGALVVSQSTGTGRAGNVNIAANESVWISGSGLLNRSGLAVNAHDTGDGGKLTVNTKALTLTDYGGIEAATAGKGNGGDIVINAETVFLSADANIFSGSAADADGGDAGNIWIRALDKMEMENSKITTHTEDADGGNIDINASNLLKLFNSTVSTSVAGGAGDGGNITIDPAFVILDNTSRVIANAYLGSGGNIGISADYYLAWPGSVVDASSQLGIQGTVEIDSPNIDLSGVLAVLSESGEIPEMRRDSCAGRHAQSVSSLVVTGQGGLPQAPAGMPAGQWVSVRGDGP